MTTKVGVKNPTSVKSPAGQSQLFQVFQVLTIREKSHYNNRQSKKYLQTPSSSPPKSHAVTAKIPEMLRPQY